MQQYQQDNMFIVGIGFVSIIFGGLLMDSHLVFTGLAVAGFGLGILLSTLLLSVSPEKDNKKNDEDNTKHED